MSFAYLPLYTGDYLRDTRHLTPMRHGIYLLALMHCWDSQGPMPLDEQESAGICNCRSSDEIDGLRYVLQRFFILMDDGWYNKRMADEVAKAERTSAARSEGGLRSAMARKAKAHQGFKDKATRVELKLNSSSTQAEVQLVSPSPSPSPSQEETHPTLPEPKSAKLKPVWTLPPGIDPGAWAEFEGHRKEIQKPLTDRARSANAKILAAMSPVDQRRSVEATIASRWTGLFPPKPNGANHADPHRRESDVEADHRVLADCEARARAHFPEMG